MTDLVQHVDDLHAQKSIDEKASMKIPEPSSFHVSLEVVHHLAHHISTSFMQFFQETNNIDERTMENLKQHLEEQIMDFLLFIRRESNFYIAEIVHAVILIDFLISIDEKRVQQGLSTIIKESVTGTLLLDALVVSGKVFNDKPHSNGWWARIVGVPVSVLSASELIFLDRIDYSTFVEPSLLLKTIQSFT